MHRAVDTGGHGLSRKCSCGLSRKAHHMGGEARALLSALPDSFCRMHTGGEKLMEKWPPAANAMFRYRQAQD